MHILQIETDLGYAQETALTLARHGILSDHARCGGDGLVMLESFRYSALVLELSLPDLDGMEVIQFIRTRRMPLPIITASNRATTADKVGAINIGSDDYITKPFEIEELIARIYAVLRRHKHPADSFLTTGDVRLDPLTGEAWVSNEPVSFLPKERIILGLLMSRPGELVVNEEVGIKLFGPERRIESNVIKVHIYRLRQRLRNAGSKCHLESVYGLGYRLRAYPPLTA